MTPNSPSKKMNYRAFASMRPLGFPLIPFYLLGGPVAK